MKRSRFTGPSLCLPSVYPTQTAYLLSEPAISARSPFLDLKDFPGHEQVILLLREAGDTEQEFDTIGRELRLFGAWDEYKDIWFQALTAALEQRTRVEAETV